MDAEIITVDVVESDTQEAAGVAVTTLRGPTRIEIPAASSAAKEQFEMQLRAPELRPNVAALVSATRPGHRLVLTRVVRGFHGGKRVYEYVEARLDELTRGDKSPLLVEPR